MRRRRADVPNLKLSVIISHLASRFQSNSAEGSKTHSFSRSGCADTIYQPVLPPIRGKPLCLFPIHGQALWGGIRYRDGDHGSVERESCAVAVPTGGEARFQFESTATQPDAKELFHHSAVIPARSASIQAPASSPLNALCGGYIARQRVRFTEISLCLRFLRAFLGRIQSFKREYPSSTRPSRSNAMQSHTAACVYCPPFSRTLPDRRPHSRANIPPQLKAWRKEPDQPLLPIHKLSPRCQAPSSAAAHPASHPKRRRIAAGCRIQQAGAPLAPIGVPSSK